MQRRLLITLLAVLTAPAVVAAQGAGAGCAPDNAGLKLPAGFCASIFADTVRGARHLVVAPNGDVFVSTQGRGAGGVDCVAAECERPAGVEAVCHGVHVERSRAVRRLSLYRGASVAARPERPVAPGTPSVIAILRYPLKAG